MTESHSGPRDRPVQIDLTPAMVEAGRAAMIEWYEGVRDFGEGAVSVFAAMSQRTDRPTILQGNAEK